jgi:hypothetical protein
MSTFGTIKSNVYDQLQLSSSPPAAVVTRIERSINRWHRRILSGPVMRSLRRIQLTQASVADQWDYGIGLEEIYYITDRTNNQRLHKRSESWWRDHFPDPTQFSGTPEYWVTLGSTRVSTQPANASELFAVSTAAGDTTQTLYVEGIRSNGQPVSLSVTLTGTTAVSLDTATTDVAQVTNVYLSAVAAGTVTLREDSGAGTTLATISIGQTFPRYVRYVLAPTPSSVRTRYLDGVATLVDMSNATDEPFIPADFHDILVHAAQYDDWVAHGRLKDAQWLRDEIKQRVLELRHWVWMNYEQGDPGESTDAHTRSFEETISLPIV